MDASLIWGYVAAALGGYLLGSVPFGLVLTKAAGLGDIRAIGSGNIGATNVLRTGRKDIALATLVLDALKAGAALTIARMIWGSNHAGWSEIGCIAGGAAFIGHCYPIWLNFKGGKGVATFFGVLFAGAWAVGLFAGVTWLAIFAIFRISSLAALVAAVIATITGFGGVAPDDATAWLILVLSALIFWRHRANIARLRAGTEPRSDGKKVEAAAAIISDTTPPPTEPPAAPAP